MDSTLMQKLQQFRPHFLSLFVLSSLMPFQTWAEVSDLSSQDEGIEFDSRFMNQLAGQPLAEVERFKYGNPIPSGDYQADVYVNHIRRGQILLTFVDRGENAEPISGLCLTEDLEEILALKPKAIEIKQKSACISAVESIPQAKISFNVAEQALQVVIPQELLVKQAKGYISPALWQSSDPTAFVRYDANQYISRSGDFKSKTSSLNILAGVSVGSWALRHRGSQTWFNETSTRYRRDYTYLQTAITPLHSQLTMGDFYTDNQLLSGFSLRGIKLASDQRMLPASLRGYAPLIRGVANSNAKVVVKQNDYIIYETNVPAGAFVIEDLYPNSSAGELEVVITESNGEQRSFIVPFASGIQLVRPGQWLYRVNLGRYREGEKLFKDGVFQGEAQYGLFNGFTVNTAATFAPNYGLGLLGFSTETPLGRIASHFSFSKVRLKSEKYQQDYTNKAVNLHYNVKIPYLNSYFALSAYRYFSPHHYDLQDVIYANNQIHHLRPRSVKQRYSVSLNQNLGDSLGNLYFSFSHAYFWHNQRAQKEYYLGYSNAYKNLQYQISYAESKLAGSDRKDKRFYVNLSLSFPQHRSLPRVSVNYSKHNQQDYYVRTSINGVLGQNNQVNYGLSSSKQGNLSHYAAYAGYQAPYAFINLSMSKSKNTKQYGMGMSGAVVAHPYGVTLANDISDTFAVIHAKGAKGAKINNANNAYLDWFGNGIVPYVSPYEVNYVSIDPENLEDDVEISATGREIIPRANSSIVVKFDTQSGDVAIFDVKLADGSLPPLATEAFNLQGQTLGYVVQGGRLFVRGIDKKGTIKLDWGASENNKCQFDYHLDKADGAIHSVTCLKK
ncbi:fimbria/pilus outer membrane usher protein [Pasteurella sp. PK-2025]|uniref:fimbria/pilus outer membrane usher protein n=1 Tax=Pasteurella sp. PK-2025 TaxID=3413133 RepID=UPI003C78109E